jgi:hypothetical protein
MSRLTVARGARHAFRDTDDTEIRRDDILAIQTVLRVCPHQERRPAEVQANKAK